MRPELATVLRAWRERVSPAAAGMPAGEGRRVPGLRREELAALAGLSVDYVVRLEQGRAASPSPQVLAALARALRLTTQERDHLYRAAGAAVPPVGTVPRHVTPGVQRIVDRLADLPVAVFTSTWEILRWNPPWAALLGDPSAWRGRDRNLIWRHFTKSGSRVRHGDRDLDEFEQGMVADLRVAGSRYPDDRDLAELVDSLRTTSTRFGELWQHATIEQQTSARKTIEHPAVGPVELDCDVLTVPENDLRLVVYSAQPGSASAEKLELIRVTGLQDFSRVQ
jgi:transcriptional regulator with XRE-family HTH domain